MKKLKRTVVLIIAKLVALAMKIMNHPGNNLPGSVAIRLMSDIWNYMEYPERRVFITGTNGKSTCTNLFNSVFEDAGYTTVCNTNGRNLPFGILTQIIRDSNIFGKCRKDVLILEIGEETIGEISHYIRPEYIVVTNLQRDNLSRSPSPEYVFQYMADGIVDGGKWILNGDDLLSSQLSKKGEAVFFRIKPLEGEKMVDTLVKDLPACPVCGNKIHWDFTRYQTIGQGHCVNCDFGSPQAKYVLERVDDKNLYISIDGKEEVYPKKGFRITDYYNCLALVTLCREFGMSQQQIARGLENSKIINTRLVEDEVNGHKIICSLAKGWNPVAVTSAIISATSSEENKVIILMHDDLEDRLTSTENLSYMYDSDYEFYNRDNIKRIYVLGERCYEQQLRLLLAGVPKEKIFCYEKEKEGIDNVDVSGIDNIYYIFDLTLHEQMMKYKEILKDKFREVA